MILAGKMSNLFFSKVERLGLARRDNGNYSFFPLFSNWRTRILIEISRWSFKSAEITKI